MNLPWNNLSIFILNPCTLKSILNPTFLFLKVSACFLLARESWRVPSFLSRTLSGGWLVFTGNLHEGTNNRAGGGDYPFCTMETTLPLLSQGTENSHKLEDSFNSSFLKNINNCFKENIHDSVYVCVLVCVCVRSVYGVMEIRRNMGRELNSLGLPPWLSFSTVLWKLLLIPTQPLQF